MAFLPEAEVEKVLLKQLAELGYLIETEDRIGPDSRFSERESYTDVILVKRLLVAAERINSAVPKQIVEEAVKRVTQNEFSQTAD